MRSFFVVFAVWMCVAATVRGIEVTTVSSDHLSGLHRVLAGQTPDQWMTTFNYLDSACATPTYIMVEAYGICINQYIAGGSVKNYIVSLTTSGSVTANVATYGAADLTCSTTSPTTVSFTGTTVPLVCTTTTSGGVNFYSSGFTPVTTNPIGTRTTETVAATICYRTQADCTAGTSKAVSAGGTIAGVCVPSYSTSYKSYRYTKVTSTGTTYQTYSNAACKNADGAP